MMKTEKNWLEWTVFGVGLLLTLGVAAILVREAVSEPAAPPQCSVQLDAVEEQPSGRFAVPFTVKNDGGSTAEQVVVEITVERGSETVETGEAEFAFLPRGGERRGAVELRADPRGASIEARCRGYVVPQ